MSDHSLLPIKASIGLDIGHSRVKAVLGSIINKDVTRHKVSFPTLVSSWRVLSDENAAMKAAFDTVEINGKRFFIGATVQEQDNPQAYIGDHYDWFTKFQDQYAALSKGAFQKLYPKVTPGSGRIVVVAGLPARSTEVERDFVKGITEKALNPLMQFGEQLQVITKATQADAIIFHKIFEANGALNPDFRQDSEVSTVELDGELVEKELPASMYGVIEVGHFSTDFTIRSGVYGIDNATNSTSGVHNAFSALQKELRNKGHYDDLVTTSQALMFKKIGEQDVSNLVKMATADLIQETLTTAKGLFARRRLDGLLVAGGGASLVFEAIKAEFPVAQIIPEARFAVAEGFVRRGLKDLHK